MSVCACVCMYVCVVKRFELLKLNNQGTNMLAMNMLGRNRKVREE